MKKEIRVIGFDDSPFDKGDKDLLVVGAIFKGGDAIDGIVSTKVKVDGSDATKKLVDIIKKCRYLPQLQCILLDGIAFGGFNVIDIEELSKSTSLPVIIIIRRKPDIKNIKQVLKNINLSEKIKLIDKAGPLTKVNNIYVQLIGITKEKAKQILDITCTRSDIPEPIRIAHMIASGIIKGESKGKA